MVLMKLGSESHLEQFRNGLLYMNTVSYFRNFEADQARADKFEGVTYIIQPHDLGELYIESGSPPIERIDIRREDLAGPFTIAMHRTAAEEQKLAPEGRLVEYYDENLYSGGHELLKKSSRFAYQSEYRIAIDTGTDGPFRFEIGNMSDITTEILPFNRADELLGATEDDARQAGLTCTRHLFR